MLHHLFCQIINIVVVHFVTAFVLFKRKQIQRENCFEKQHSKFICFDRRNYSRIRNTILTLQSNKSKNVFQQFLKICHSEIKIKATNFWSFHDMRNFNLKESLTPENRFIVNSLFVCRYVSQLSL